MTQIAADTLGLPIERVKFELGDTKLPQASVSGGSSTAASVSPAVRSACEAAGLKLIEMAIADAESYKDTPRCTDSRCNRGGVWNVWDSFRRHEC